MILPALGIFTICLLILMFPSATGLVCQKKYSEVHNLAFQGPSWDIDKKFGTEPIAQERCFTKSSRWLTVLSGCPRTPRGTPFVTWTSGNCQDQILLTRKWTRLMANSFLPGVSTDVAEYLKFALLAYAHSKGGFFLLLLRIYLKNY